MSIMTTTRTSIEILNELYPASLPSPRFTTSCLDMEKSVQPASEHDRTEYLPRPEPSVTASLVSILTYVGPLLCLIYVTLLGYAYGCPIIADNLDALGLATSMSPDHILAAALLVSSVGLITLGLDFLRKNELHDDDARI
jgi:hypothetical protein